MANCDMWLLLWITFENLLALPRGGRKKTVWELISVTWDGLSDKLYLSPVMKDNFEYNLSIILMNQYSGTNSGASRTWRNMLVKCTQTVSSQADDFLRIAENQFEEERWRCRRLFGLRLLPPICCRGCMTMLSESSRRRKFSWNKWPQILSNIK